jgi:uncharacterized membrane protein
MRNSNNNMNQPNPSGNGQRRCKDNSNCKYDYPTDEHETTGGEGYEPQTYEFYCCSWHAILSMIFFLACTFFTILVIYSLVTNNTEAVRGECKDLYPYMVTRTALSFCVFLAVCTYGLVYGPTDPPERNPVMAFFFLVYFVVLAIWGAVVVSKSMIGNQKCHDALYDNAFQAPLMGDLGWVYVVVDVFYALCTTLIILRTQVIQAPSSASTMMDTSMDQA